MRAFWASPVITLEARSELIEALSQRADVVVIRPDQKLYLDQTTFEICATLSSSIRPTLGS